MPIDGGEMAILGDHKGSLALVPLCTLSHCYLLKGEDVLSRICAFYQLSAEVRRAESSLTEF